MISYLSRDYQLTPRAIHREVENAGWACQLDLFSVPQSTANSPHALHRSDAQGARVRGSSQYSPEGANSDVRPQDIYSTPLPLHPTSATPHDEVLAYHLGAPVLDSSACTTYLVGTLIATSSLIFYGGENQIMFTFHVRTGCSGLCAVRLPSYSCCRTLRTSR